MFDISRRHGMGLAGLMALGLGDSAAAAPSPQFNFEDPQERTRIRAKVVGSTIEETVYILYRLHLYAYMHDGNLIPMMTMSNLNATQWKPLPDGTYSATVNESGVYTKFDTEEPLDVFVNPVTGVKREMKAFIDGPIKTRVGPNGSITDETATLKPKAMRMESFGGVVFVAAGSAFAYRNVAEPDSPKNYWDSHSFHMARAADVANPAIHRAPSFSGFQNLISFNPTSGMEGKPGRTWGKAFGAKLNGVDDIPKATRAMLEKQTPQIFDLKDSFWSRERPRFR